MKKLNENVKIIPESNVIGVSLGSLIELTQEYVVLNVSFDNNFEVYQLFEIIIEEDNILNIFKANLMKKDNNEYKFKLASEIKKITKREYERCNITLDVSDKKKYQAKTTNISAGGMQILAEKPLKADKELNLYIDFEGREISVKYLPLRIEEELNSYIISGKFSHIQKEDKAFILQQNLKKKIDIRYQAKKMHENKEGEE